MRRIASLLALTLAAAPTAALACSPAPGYRVPTNLELAAEADAIVLGEALTWRHAGAFVCIMAACAFLFVGK